MSTPADLLAQQQESVPSTTAASFSSDSMVASETESTSFTGPSSDAEEDKIVEAASTPSLLDESAFPVLGSAPAKTTKTVWGASNVVSNGHSAKLSNPVLIRSLNVQESFSIDLDQQITITKTELFKIVSAVKAQFKVNVESTLSQKTNKRTFLITGNEESIKKARREIIRKMTKPVSLEFNIPSKLRRIVIGPSGRNLTPIINATGVKVDIEKENSRTSTPLPDAEEDEDEEDEDDFFGSPVSVKIHGDADGAQTAKAMILAIVDENTKSVSVKIEVPEKLKPFINSEIDSAVPESIEISIPSLGDRSSKILISGPREEVLQLRESIKASLESLNKSVKTESKPIKKSFHRFIDLDSIFHQTNAVVSIPSNNDISSDITFTGKSKDIKQALDLTKQITDSYKVLAIEISRAHGGNIEHAKNLAAYFKFSGFLDQISTESITVSVPSYSALISDDSKSVQVDISCISGTERSLAEEVKKLIIAKVNETAPSSVKSVTDIDSFVFSQLDSSIDETAKSNNVTLIPVAKLAGAGNKLLLVADHIESDFLPTVEEVAQRLDAVDSLLNKLRDLSTSVVSEVIPLPSKEQKLIYGSNGSTLRTIVSHYTKDGVEIKLHQNKEGVSENELLIRGFKAEVPKVIKEIQQVIKDIKNHEEAVKYNATIKFPTNLLSRLIGQKGAHLNTLREKFDVRIDVEHDNEESKETAVKLTGLKVNVDAITDEINSLKKRWADEKTLKMNIEHKYHRALVGRSGMYAKRLEDKYKVSVMFPFKDSANKDEVVIRGPSKGVAKAEEEIRELLKYEIENGYKTTVTVPVQALPKVIGKNGDTINGIASDTGVEFKFSRDDEKEKELGYTEIELVGTKSAIKSAETKITDIIKAVENTVTVTISVDPKYHRIIVGPSGSTMREIISKAGGSNEMDRRLLQIPNLGSDSQEVVSTGDKAVVSSIIKQIEKLVAEKEREISDVCEVPKEKHRSLIGPNGFIRKNLETDFKVLIDIPKYDSKSTSVTVTGAPENVEAAKLKIAELTKDDWLAEVMVPASVHSAIAERGSFFRRLRNDFNVSVEHGPSARIATKLSNSNIPQPPQEAFGEEEEKSKWTVIEDTEKLEDQTIPWRLKGDAEAVKKAESVIKNLVDQSAKHTATGYFYTSKPEVFSKIVGPQGKRVLQLRERSGCFIVVPRLSDRVNNVIYVRGDKEGLEKVKNSFLASF